MPNFPRGVPQSVPKKPQGSQRTPSSVARVGQERLPLGLDGLPLLGSLHTALE